MKFYLNVGIIGYVDYGKMMFIVVIINVLADVGFVEKKDYDFIDVVLEEKECGIIINMVYVEY